MPDTLLGIVEKLTNDLDIRFTFTMADEPRGRDQAEQEAEIMAARDSFPSPRNPATMVRQDGRPEKEQI